ncbi:MAG: SDR family oxidoreductase [Clostridiales bacterium]|nr:SDR family oxidoreductase [Clostridiales bacterium]
MGILEAFSLEGKNAILTGASNDAGLCYGMAIALHEAGAKIVLLDISPDVHTLAETLGGAEKGYFAIQCDLCDADSLASAFEQALALFDGQLDILLNGAGLQFRNEALSFPADKWRGIIDVNLSAMFFACQAAAKAMIPKGKGKIINIASLTSYFGSRNIPAYAASKGGVMQLTKALSNEWCALGINVNAIAPGYMKTKLTENLIDTDLGRIHTGRIPAGRWGESKDLMGVTVFLASSASDYVSGAIIPVDGGYLGF